MCVWGGGGGGMKLNLRGSPVDREDQGETNHETEVTLVTLSEAKWGKMKLNELFGQKLEKRNPWQ